jgi:hypothetical protein
MAVVVAVPAVAPTPMAAMPAPMAMAPMTVVPVMPPPHFFRLEAIDLVAGGHRGTDIFIGGKSSVLRKRLRRKRRGLCAGSQRGGSGGKSKGEFKKIPAFHDISSMAEVMTECRSGEMNVR